MILDMGSASQFDLGASTGGATFAYNATYFPIEIDQTILPASAYKTKEEIIFSVTLVEEKCSTLQAAMSLQAANVTTTSSGTLATPAAPTSVVPTPTGGATPHTYALVAFNYNGDTPESPTTTDAAGPVTLDATHYETISWGAMPTGAIGVKVIRTAGGPNQGIIATIYNPAAGTLNDTGLTAQSYTPSLTNPPTAGTQTVTFGGDLSVPLHSFDWAIPKNDGTTNHWLGHLNRCFSGRAVTIDWMRTKQTDIAKVELMALADTSQPIGQQAGYLTEQI